MTGRPAALSTLAFGDLESTVWGAAWRSDSGDGQTLLILADGGGRMAVERLAGGAHEPTDEWRVGDDQNGLTVSPVGEPVLVRDPEDRIEGYDQLCRVTRRLDGERTVECLGVHSWFSVPVDLERYESIRAVSTWFGPDEAMALTAFRGRKAKAHDADVVAAAVIGPESSMAVEDPRLSTTYAAEGRPVRAGLELWLPNPKDSEQQFPRRVSGEVAGAGAQAQTDGLELRAEPFRWHSRGRDGAGMYILARRQ
jgi:hypothetical protein